MENKFVFTQNQFINYLQILFIGLKLLNKIDWNWFFVLLPIICWGVTMLIAFILWVIKKINS